ncbi:heterogeneous nuclear ribonucleoprotein K homolog isoform X2 [Halichondria panicea]|uniref:heterogeneous nuclear ribonucleoprotein K homolog isoform X2 n=1 Tax=Halichondria panicea TaxID=6063 RepID=UPI00312BBBE3
MSEGQNDRKRSSEDGYQGDSVHGDLKKPRTEKPPATLRLLVRNRDAGGIIGKGGDTIKRLRREFDCHVMLPDTSGSPERVLTVMGEIEHCVSVLGEVLKILPEQEGSRSSERETQILIPQPFMGTLIGTGGSKINELRRRVTATIKIFSEPMPGSNERSIQVTGEVDQVCECARSFLDDISKLYDLQKESREPIYLYEPGAGGDFQSPAFFNDFRGGRGGPRGRGGFRGRGRGFAPRGRGGPPPFNPPPPAFKPPGPGPTMGGPRPAMGGGPGPAMGGPRPVMGGPGPAMGGPGPVMGGPGPAMGGPGSAIGGPGPGVPRSQYNNAPPTMPNPTPRAAPLVPQQVPPTMPPPNSVGYPPRVGYGAPTSTYPPQSNPPPVPQQPQYAPQVHPNAPVHQFTAPPPSHMATPPVPLVQQSSQQVTIPLEFTDAILGPNGSRLAGIKAQSSCEITLNPPTPGTSERIISIMGSSQGIQIAQQLMQNSVRQYHPNV